MNRHRNNFMKAYLDYNIFTAIEDGNFSIAKIYEKVDSSITDFPCYRAF